MKKYNSLLWLQITVTVDRPRDVHARNSLVVNVDELAKSLLPSFMIPPPVEVTRGVLLTCCYAFLKCSNPSYFLENHQSWNSLVLPAILNWGCCNCRSGHSSSSILRAMVSATVACRNRGRTPVAVLSAPGKPFLSRGGTRVGDNCSYRLGGTIPVRGRVCRGCGGILAATDITDDLQCRVIDPSLIVLVVVGPICYSSGALGGRTASSHESKSGTRLSKVRGAANPRRNDVTRHIFYCQPVFFIFVYEPIIDTLLISVDELLLQN